METTDSQVRDLLQAARDLLAKSGWCRGANARSRSGHWASIDAPRATHFCALGAILRVAEVTDEARLRSTTLAAERLAEVLRHWLPEEEILATRIVSWNDGLARSKRDMLALFDAALAADGDGK
jgi:hypothetical protein